MDTLRKLLDDVARAERAYDEAKRLDESSPEPLECEEMTRSDHARAAGVQGEGQIEDNLRDLLEAAKEDAYIRLLRRRGVVAPCPSCQGLGTRAYSSGSTWRGGMGTSSATTDVCDTCWGTGDAHRFGANLRELAAARDAWGDTQAVQYFARSLGIRFTGAKERLEELAKLCEKQARKRSGPDAGEFWYVQGWEMTAAVLRRIAKGAGNE